MCITAENTCTSLTDVKLKFSPQPNPHTSKCHPALIQIHQALPSLQCISNYILLFARFFSSLMASWSYCSVCHFHFSRIFQFVICILITCKSLESFKSLIIWDSFPNNCPFLWFQVNWTSINLLCLNVFFLYIPPIFTIHPGLLLKHFFHLQWPGDMI